MGYYNIFQGNKFISDTIIEGLKLKDTENAMLYSEKYYFQAFFYLTKRFGTPEIWNEDKDAGAWLFKVKEFKILISMDGFAVNFMIFGNAKYKDYSSRTPYIVAYWRKSEKVAEKLYHEDYNQYNKKILELTEAEKKINQEIWEHFLKLKGVDDTWTQARLNREIKQEWFYYTEKYNQKITGISPAEYKKYGRDYSNSKTKFALKTLKQFLNNMLTPIWIRDCAFNILGRTNSDFKKYENNIKIKRIEL